MKTTNIAILTLLFSFVFFACQKEQKEPTDYLPGIYNVIYTSSSNQSSQGFFYDTINNAYLEIVKKETSRYQLNLYRDCLRQDTVFYNRYNSVFDVQDKPVNDCTNYEHFNIIPDYYYYKRNELKIQNCDSLFFKYEETCSYQGSYSQTIWSYRGVKLQ